MLKSKNYKLRGLFAVLPLSILLLILSNSKHRTFQLLNTEVAQQDKVRALNEASGMDTSENDTWWLNSGGRVYFDKDIIRTIQGDLPDDDYWRLRYRDSNPTETDDGYHPQNIFRLVTRTQYEEPVQSMYFKINRYILSDDEHRASPNGVLIFQHYLDGDNLYYAGLRVDGQAVIKKKTKGVYYTMAYEPVFTESEYDRDTNPNLLPTDTWLGIKTELQNLESGAVQIKLYMDKDKSGNWELVVEATDNGSLFGGAPITESGYAGIRTDFMDVEFKGYSVEN